jgi:hypothetical protein
VDQRRAYRPEHNPRQCAGQRRVAVMMIDRIGVKERMMIAALGITTEGVKVPLGL